VADDAFADAPEGLVVGSTDGDADTGDSSDDVPVGSTITAAREDAGTEEESEGAAFIGFCIDDVESSTDINWVGAVAVAVAVAVVAVVVAVVGVEAMVGC
jgi:hypothetical protein